MPRSSVVAGGNKAAGDVNAVSDAQPCDTDYRRGDSMGESLKHKSPETYTKDLKDALDRSRFGGQRVECRPIVRETWLWGRHAVDLPRNIRRRR